jgi:hypothetical protein
MLHIDKGLFDYGSFGKLFAYKQSHSVNVAFGTVQ